MLTFSLCALGRTSRPNITDDGHSKMILRHHGSGEQDTIIPRCDTDKHARAAPSSSFLSWRALSERTVRVLPSPFFTKRPTLGICPPKRLLPTETIETMNKNPLLITPHPSPSLAEPPTTAPLLQPLNTSWLDDSDIPSFLATSAGSKRRHDFDLDASLPAASESASNKFFLATPLEMARNERSTATRSNVNVVTPPSSPRFRLRMRPSTSSGSSVDDILTGQTTSPSTPAPTATNSTPMTNLPVSSERISFNMMTDLSVVSMKLSDHAAAGVKEEQHKSAPSVAVPKIGVSSKRRKTMRRNSSFNALCA